MNKIMKLSLVAFVFFGLTFAKSNFARKSTPLVKKSNFDFSMRIDKGEKSFDNQSLDKKRSHKRRRKVRKPRKGIR